MNTRYNLHCTIYSSAISSCGQFIALGNNFGEITIVEFASKFSSKTHSKFRTLNKFNAHDGPVYALLTVDKWLISAGSFPVVIWNWENLVGSEPKPLHKFDDDCLPNNANATSLCYDDKTQLLFVAGEDASVCILDLNKLSYCGSLNGHTQCIHDITLLSRSLATASEDGKVKVWDSCNYQCIQTIEPSSCKELKRPTFGKWVGSIASDSTCEWIVIGGGPMPSLWHLRSTSLATPLQCAQGSESFVPHSLEFFGNEIIGGGNDSTLYRWTSHGKMRAAVPCTIPNIFSINFLNKSSLPAVITGTSHKVQLFTNLGYEGPCISIS